ncbi:MAG: hypothetical protein U5J97_03410 [Trueperaceae bacterium]|nr:hypothetical protein [Trueperaceae bacterium]
MACALRLRGIARLRHDPPDEALAEASFRRALALYRELGDVEGVATMLNDLAYRVSRPSESIAALQEAHELAHDAGETHALAMISGSLALLLLYCSGSYAAAHAAAEQSVAGHEATGFTWQGANTSLILAEACLTLGDATSATAVARRALDLGSQFQGGAAAAIRGGAHAILGNAARLRGERDAHEHYRTALRMLRAANRNETAAWARVMSLDGLARIARAQDRPAAMRDLADEALAHLASFEPSGSYFMPAALRLTCRVRLGEAFVLEGEHEPAERHLHETLSLARAWGAHPRSWRPCSRWGSSVAAKGGRPRRATSCGSWRATRPVRSRSRDARRTRCNAYRRPRRIRADRPCRSTNCWLP